MKFLVHLLVLVIIREQDIPRLSAADGGAMLDLPKHTHVVKEVLVVKQERENLDMFTLSIWVNKSYQIFR
jgi:hypothetical protein